jgi:hypothetical protein
MRARDGWPLNLGVASKVVHVCSYELHQSLRLHRLSSLLLLKPSVMEKRQWDVRSSSNGRTTWVALEDTKNSCPVQLAEHAAQRPVAGDPALAWWIQHVLNK